MGKQWKQWKALFSWAPKSLWMVTLAMKLKDTCSLGKKNLGKPRQPLKSRDISLPTNVHLVKDTVFPVVMYGCESCAIKKTGCWGIDSFELCCWRRLLRFLWTERRSNQLILKEMNSEYSFGGTPILWSPYVKSIAELLEKTLMLTKIEGPRRRGWQRMK